MLRFLAAPLAAALLMLTPGIVSAATTPPDSAAAQPTLPGGPPKPGSPVVNSLVGAPSASRTAHPRRHVAHVVPHAISHARRYPRVAARAIDVARPALAGVALLAPLPPPPEPPHIVVPMPEYALDSIAAAFTTPPPPIMCHRTPRIRDLPDPRLYREVTLDCLPDNP